jgi:hypothetical protein
MGDATAIDPVRRMDADASASDGTVQVEKIGTVKLRTYRPACQENAL